MELTHLDLILGVVAKLTRNGRRIGNTHVHKVLYFVQHGLGVPVDFKHKLYRHGPYSEELASTLRVMVDRGYLVRNSEPGSRDGYYMVDSRATPRTPYEAQLDFATRTFASWDRKRLESVMTTLWFRRTFPFEDDAEVRSRLCKLKPHITPDEAKKACQDLDLVLGLAESADVVPPGAVRGRRGAVPEDVLDSPGSDTTGPVLAPRAEDILICDDGHPLADKLLRALVTAGLVPAVPRTDSLTDLAAAMSAAGAIVIVATPAEQTTRGTTQLRLLSSQPTDWVTSALTLAAAKHRDKTTVLTAGPVRLPETARVLDTLTLEATRDQFVQLLRRLERRGFRVDLTRLRHRGRPAA